MATPATQIERGAVPGGAGLGNTASAAWTRARGAWGAMPAVQRGWSVATGLILAALVGGIFWYALRTDWRTLYAGMEPDDARQTGLTLTQAQIPYEVGANGTSILVPAPELDKARLATAAKGTLKSGRMGFELFDKPNWVGSEFDERVNYQRALEGELERTVETLNDVESARVDLVMAHDSLFRDEQRPAKASVVLKLRHGSLADGEATAIRNLVASAVDGLTPEHVVLVDAEGHLPLGPKTAEAKELAAEQALQDKLIATLEPVTGPGNVRASVTLEYDPQSVDETKEVYDPTQTVTLSMQRSQQTSGPQPIPAGVPGAASNAPNTQAKPPVYPQQTAPPESSTSESDTYGVSKTVSHTVAAPGQLKRLTAAVVVNDRMVKPAGKNTPAQWQARSPEELRELTALAQAAVGFNASRGDVVTVQNLSFEANQPAPAEPMQSRMLTLAQHISPELIKYVALLVGLLLVLFFGLRPALRMARTAGAQAAGAQGQLPGSAAAQLGSVEPPAQDPERLRAQEIFDQVAGHLKREPTQSSRLLQSWIHSE
ncbi:MAG TPA: flagellar basal-body MS-ring/collar protein FliF [Terracidiphilus sp.]|nr:flagellar basal-body MS-ring/collar protein FliF [Terracidiphilus sp.]